MAQQKIVVLGTGGTIAGTVNDASPKGAAVGDYTAAQLGVGQLLDSVPGLRANLRGCELALEQVAQIDSKDMALDTWRQLAQRCAHWLAQAEVTGLVITHGTDTLEETAYFLQAVLQPVKPVVLTCAMRPADAPAPDGPQNLRDALALVQDAQASGVMAVCAGWVHGARDVQKVHSARLDAFASGDAGPLGCVRDNQVHWLRGNPAVAAPADALAHWGAAKHWPQVDIVMSYAGANGTVVDALVRAGVAGVVVAGTGSGTLHHALEAALLRAQAVGVRVLRASRCAQGRVLPRPGDVIPGSGDLSPVKARVALLLELVSSPAPQTPAR